MASKSSLGSSSGRFRELQSKGVEILALISGVGWAMQTAHAGSPAASALMSAAATVAFALCLALHCRIVPMEHEHFLVILVTGLHTANGFQGLLFAGGVVEAIRSQALAAVGRRMALFLLAARPMPLSALVGVEAVLDCIDLWFAVKRFGFSELTFQVVLLALLLSVGNICWCHWQRSLLDAVDAFKADVEAEKATAASILQLASGLCLGLSKDGRSVVRSDALFDKLMERPMQGRVFADALSEQTRKDLKELISSGQSPAKRSAVLQTTSGPVSAEFLLVRRQSETEGEPGLLLGLRLSEGLPSSEVHGHTAVSHPATNIGSREVMATSTQGAPVGLSREREASPGIPGSQSASLQPRYVGGEALRMMSRSSTPLGMLSQPLQAPTPPPPGLEDAVGSLPLGTFTYPPSPSRSPCPPGAESTSIGMASAAMSAIPATPTQSTMLAMSTHQGTNTGRHMPMESMALRSLPLAHIPATPTQSTVCDSFMSIEHSQRLWSGSPGGLASLDPRASENAMITPPGLPVTCPSPSTASTRPVSLHGASIVVCMVNGAMQLVPASALSEGCRILCINCATLMLMEVTVREVGTSTAMLTCLEREGVFVPSDAKLLGPTYVQPRWRKASMALMDEILVWTATVVDPYAIQSKIWRCLHCNDGGMLTRDFAVQLTLEGPADCAALVALTAQGVGPQHGCSLIAVAALANGDYDSQASLPAREWNASPGSTKLRVDAPSFAPRTPPIEASSMLWNSHSSDSRLVGAPQNNSDWADPSQDFQSWNLRPDWMMTSLAMQSWPVATPETSMDVQGLIIGRHELLRSRTPPQVSNQSSAVAPMRMEKIDSENIAVLDSPPAANLAEMSKASPLSVVPISVAWVEGQEPQSESSDNEADPECDIVIGGSDMHSPWRFRGEAGWKREGPLEESRAGSLRYSDFIALPKDSTGERLSFGSVDHAAFGNQCKVCVHHRKEHRLCRSGALCSFCHAEHTPYKRMTKGQRRAARATREDGAQATGEAEHADMILNKPMSL